MTHVGLPNIEEITSIIESYCAKAYKGQPSNSPDVLLNRSSNGTVRNELPCLTLRTVV